MDQWFVIVDRCDVSHTTPNQLARPNLQCNIDQIQSSPSNNYLGWGFNVPEKKNTNKHTRVSAALQKQTKRKNMHTYWSYAKILVRGTRILLFHVIKLLNRILLKQIFKQRLLKRNTIRSTWCCGCCYVNIWPSRSKPKVVTVCIDTSQHRNNLDFAVG